ncbi:hypothetical protein [Paenibacillus sp. JJ-223]|uniref:hypothetical protein n=1 Tax=Paenibacillus sp. JJ-223 TaxID=2905647 RepID=UPI001F2E709A|nr:hypothetical protein [Paenibacillus sp. JJ-223]CAH1224477.1 hypothetical protein PAECIP111890_05673 [Paenibacillus sp. JJ-223]
MIQVLEVRDIQMESEVKYSNQVNTYNVTTNLMSDDYVPYRLAQSAMIWLGPNGELGELELIFPKVSEQSFWPKHSFVETVKGVPLFKIDSQPSDVTVAHQKDGFMIWIDQNHEVNVSIISQNLIFLLSDKKLIGIYCKYR